MLRFPHKLKFVGDPSAEHLERAVRETNTLLKTSRSLKSGQGASDLIKECVAETGGGRCARYRAPFRLCFPRLAGTTSGCERRATRAERRQSRTERSRQAEGKTRSDSKEPQWDIQDYRKGEGRFASVAKQFPKEADELFAAAQENAQWRYKSYLRMLGTAW